MEEKGSYTLGHASRDKLGFPSFPATSSFFMAHHERLLKKYVDKGDDALQKIGIVFLSTGPWSWGVPLVCYLN